MLSSALISEKQPITRDEIINDYRIAYKSRQASIMGRRDVLGGKAKFGIFGDGKEIVQIAMAKVFRKGDFRSGYYRDQTFMFALGGDQAIREFFSQLYAHADVSVEPASAGRMMVAHFSTRTINPDGSWKNLIDHFNSSPDVSPTGSQMPRLVGLAYASRLYRELPALQTYRQFSDHGDEIAFGTIGNASTAEGMFWEAINAIGVLNAPAIVIIYDDGYGISVTNEYQMVKQNLSELLGGFQQTKEYPNGYNIYRVKGWDYPALVDTFQNAEKITRSEHIPSIIHVVELTQPQGHSTSGSHERYKPKDRLRWEVENDGLEKFRQWIINQGLASETELTKFTEEDRGLVQNLRNEAWENYVTPILQDRNFIISKIDTLSVDINHATRLSEIKNRLINNPSPYHRDNLVAVRDILIEMKDKHYPEIKSLINWKQTQISINHDRYSSHLYSDSAESALTITEQTPDYSPDSPYVYGYELLNRFFDFALARDPRLIIFGEDVGHLGDVNQGLRGLQAKYGQLRVSDTGIRETTIIGQAIGMALRGLRPIAEIQYLDYLLYALQIMSDDLATIRWRTSGGQKAPVIIRTRGHRLEGVWHSGSLLAGIINLVRGMYVLVPRDMTRAAGFYNTMLKSDDPAIIVEVLNGYRIKERLPQNISEMTIPLGIPEVLRAGSDITIVTYGACCKIVMEAAGILSKLNIDAEVIDIQTLLPFDVFGRIGESLKKTSHILFVDEDVPGGTTAYMYQQVLEKQNGYYLLDSPARTLSGREHRPAYGSDGDYWSKPNTEQIIEIVYEMMSEVSPARYPRIF